MRHGDRARSRRVQVQHVVPAENVGSDAPELLAGPQVDRNHLVGRPRRAFSTTLPEARLLSLVRTFALDHVQDAVGTDDGDCQFVDRPERAAFRRVKCLNGPPGYGELHVPAVNAVLSADLGPVFPFGRHERAAVQEDPARDVRGIESPDGLAVGGVEGDQLAGLRGGVDTVADCEERGPVGQEQPAVVQPAEPPSPQQQPVVGISCGDVLVQAVRQVIRTRQVVDHRGRERQAPSVRKRQASGARPPVGLALGIADVQRQSGMPPQAEREGHDRVTGDSIAVRAVVGMRPLVHLPGTRLDRYTPLAVAEHAELASRCEDPHGLPGGQARLGRRVEVLHDDDVRQVVAMGQGIDGKPLDRGKAVNAARRHRLAHGPGRHRPARCRARASCPKTPARPPGRATSRRRSR